MSPDDIGINNPEVEEHADTDIVSNMLMFIHPGTRNIGGYKSSHHWVLQHGQFFVNEQLDRDLGPEKLCYYNSQRLMMGSLTTNYPLLYVEGYVSVHGMPIEHGWNITPDGEVIDTTLRIDGAEYFGFVFSKNFVMVHIDSEGMGFPIIHNWQAGFPMLRDNVVVHAGADQWNWKWDLG